MDRSRRTSWLVVAALIGLAIAGVLLYPIASAWVTNFTFRREVAGMQRDFPDKDPHFQETLTMLLGEAKRYNEELVSVGQLPLSDPFTSEQPSFDLSGFAIFDYVIGFLSIEAIDVDVPILLGANAYGLERGAVQITQSSLPIGGASTNAVIAAHRNEATTMFRDLGKLDLGDTIRIRNYWDILTYQVVEIRIINPADVGELTIQPGRDLVTLITEHPPGQSSQRYVVIAERIE